MPTNPHQISYTAEPKIGFPHRVRGGWRQLWRKVPFGWKDAGKDWTLGCNFCNTTIRLAVEDERKFMYCPKCELL